MLRAAGRPAVVEDLVLRPLGPCEVRVRLAASGVCHTDLSVRDGAMPALLPCTLGHEGAGVVADVGGDVTTVAAGDHVVLTWNVPCRRCRDCLRGDPQLCAHGLDHAFGVPYAASAAGSVWPSMGAGTLAEYTLLPAAAVVPVDRSLPLHQAALLGCAVITGVGAALRSAAVRPGESVLVIGCGGVGLAAIQGARLAGAGRIIAVDMVGSKLNLAKEFGATDVVDAKAGDPVAQVIEMTKGGVHHSFEAVGLKKTAEQAFKMLARGGTANVIGMIPLGQTIELHGADFLGEKRIQGCAMGSNRFPVDMPRLVDFYLSGKLKLDDMISRRIKLKEVNEAFDELKRGEIARSVIVFDA